MVIIRRSFTTELVKERCVMLVRPVSKGIAWDEILGVVWCILSAIVGLLPGWFIGQHLTPFTILLLSALWAGFLTPIVDEAGEFLWLTYTFGGGGFLLGSYIVTVIHNWSWFWSQPATATMNLLFK